MIRALLKRSFRQFGARYKYDTSYMIHITETSTSAGLRMALLPFYSQFRGPREARTVWAGAMLASTLDGDCGPCGQLVVDMALHLGISADQIALCLQGQPQSLNKL